jgi:2-oxoisovalerate ferredoxin oxidoreductase gamma subunit
MIEIRFHGRGGQGTVVASEILAAAFFLEGRQVQAFPTFGVERRGAPVAAFVRVDHRPIRLRCQIDRPHHVVVLDPTLIPVVDVAAGLRPEGSLLVNSRHEPGHFTTLAAPGRRLATVDASGIAAVLGLGSPTNPIVNTAILGAFAAATGLLSLESILASIPSHVPRRPEANIEAAKRAFMSVRCATLEGVAT